LGAMANQIEAAYHKEIVGTGLLSDRQKPAKMRLLRNTLFGDIAYQAFSTMVTMRLALPGACRSVYCYEFLGSNGCKSTHGEQFQNTYGPYYKGQTNLKCRTMWMDSYSAFLRSGNPNTAAMESCGGWLPCSNGIGPLMRMDTERGCKLSVEGHEGRHGLRTIVDLFERLWHYQPVPWPSAAPTKMLLATHEAFEKDTAANADSEAESHTTAGSDGISLSDISETGSPGKSDALKRLREVSMYETPPARRQRLDGKWS